MLEYMKTILTKVSFNPRIFERELKKAIKTLIADEVRELRNWCYVRFGDKHQKVLQRCFVSV
ncbi:MAG: hypothetical protein WD555_06205 [Fulvivirga sp.]